MTARECIRCGKHRFFLFGGICGQCIAEAHLAVCSVCKRPVAKEILLNGECACCRKVALKTSGKS